PASKIPLGHLSPGTKLSPNAVIDTLRAQKLPNTVRERLVWLVVLFVLELTTISVWLDAASLSRAYFLTYLMLNWGAWTLRGAVAFAFLFLIFAYLRNPSGLGDLL